MIQVEHLNVTKQETTILEDINLTIRKGDKILLKGESGSGKSTLIKSLLYFEHFTGRILFNDNPITRENLCLYRRQSGYIGQTIPNFTETVRDFLAIPYGFKANKDRAMDPQRLRDLLETLNFDESTLEKKYQELSGGEKQRLVILQMLLLDRPIYFLDEVTSALDKKNITAAVAAITNDKERTVLSIAHNPEWEEHCTRIIEMAKGKIVKDVTAGGN